MFEWGVFRLQTTLQQFAWDRLDLLPNQFAYARYGWDKN
jgi:hypothetical protein